MARLLLVDDDIEFLNVMDQGLRMNQFEVFACQDPMEALRVITEFSFDAILTDLQMPRMSGLQLISYIKASEKNKDSAIFILSGHDLGSMPLKDINVVRILPKPFAMGELVSALHEVTEKALVHKRPVAYAPQLVSIFKSSCLKILDYYAGKPLTAGLPYIKTKPDRINTYYGMVCLFGKRLYGSMAFGCEGVFLEKVLSTIFMGQEAQGQTIEPLAIETFLEILNQMAGSFKSEMLKKFVSFKIGLPELAPSSLKTYKHKVSGHTICFPLILGEDEMHLELCLGSLSAEKEIEDQSFELFLTAS